MKVFGELLRDCALQVTMASAILGYKVGGRKLQFSDRQLQIFNKRLWVLKI